METSSEELEKGGCPHLPENLSLFQGAQQEHDHWKTVCSAAEVVPVTWRLPFKPLTSQPSPRAACMAWMIT